MAHLLTLVLSLLMLFSAAIAVKRPGYNSHETPRNASLSLSGGSKGKASSPFGAINNLNAPVGRFAPRQEGECPGEAAFPVCQPDLCCPEDTTACGAVNPAYCHYPGTICCPEPADTSCPDDTTCCGTDACCDDGYECMDDRICCLPEAVACDSWCCPEATECSEEEGYCLEPGGETSAGSEPSQTEQSSIGEPSESAPSKSTRPTESSETPSLSLPSLSLPSSETAPSKSSEPTESSESPSLSLPSSRAPSKSSRPTESSESTPSLSLPSISIPSSSSSSTSSSSSITPSSHPSSESSEPQSSPTPSKTLCNRDDGCSSSSTVSSPTCSLSGTPTLIMPYIPDKTDELIDNICLGLRKFGFTDRQQLNYAGPGKSAANRKLTDCGGGKCCAGQFKTTGVNRGVKLTCDEYPFASTTQSSPNSWVGCILGFQNTAGGFVYLNNFLRDELKYTPGCPFIMQVDPSYDCRTVSASAIPGCTKKTRRQSSGAASTNGVFYDAYANAHSPGTLIIELGDLPAGTYAVDVTFPADAVVSRVLVGDADGNEYNVQQAPASGSTYRFTAVLDDFAYSAALIAETTSDDLSVDSWSVESTGDTPAFSSGGSNLLPSSTSSVSTASTTTTSCTTTTSTTTSCTTTPTTTCTKATTTTTSSCSTTSTPSSSTVTIVTVISGVTTTITTCPVTESRAPPPPPPSSTTTIVTVISGVTTTITTCPVTESRAPPPPPPPPSTTITFVTVISGVTVTTTTCPEATATTSSKEAPPPAESHTSSPEEVSHTHPPPVETTRPTTTTTKTTPATEPTTSTSTPAAVVTASAPKADVVSAKMSWVVLAAVLFFINL